MSLKINVGLCKKMGLPDYGSIGASCNVEAEVDESLDDLDGFHQRVRRAFVACAQAVNDELNRHTQGNAPSRPPAQERSNGNANGNGHSNGNGNGNGNAQQATGKQHEYIRRLAGFIKGLGARRLETLTLKMFDKQPSQLNGFEASSLIDTLKAIKAGNIQLNDALNGEAA